MYRFLYLSNNSSEQITHCKGMVTAQNMSEKAIFTINRLTVVCNLLDLTTTLQTNEFPNRAMIVVIIYSVKTKTSLKRQTELPLKSVKSEELPTFELLIANIVFQFHLNSLLE